MREAGALSDARMHDVLDSADARCLRLAAPPITDEGLDALVGYLREVLAASSRGVPFAKAHARALEGSALTVHQLAQVQTVMADFCGRRWAAMELERRLSRAQSNPDDPRERAVAERLSGELDRVGDLSALERRYGPEAIARLRKREQELVELHRAYVDLVRRAG